MAINNLPVMWLFATRNNFLLWATGWDFATFNMFHRWIARACGLEVFVHGMCVCIYQNLGESAAGFSRCLQRTLKLTLIFQNLERNISFFFGKIPTGSWQLLQV